MGNKLSGSPFPNYETAAAQFDAAEIEHLRKQFHIISHGREVISFDNFISIDRQHSTYLRKHVYPRVFHLCNTKRSGALDFEEYLCAVAVFRVGTIEDKIKCLYLMYDGNKSGGSLSKENFRQLLVDATIAVQRDCPPIGVLEEWISDLHQLSLAMVETALIQYSSHAHKLDVVEFIAFVKIEGTVQGLLHLIPEILDN